ncbi:MAG TPA: hypothetical protein PKA05_17860, partial [Roseiflexaceae bacterium]|nr:hypothetical protein [Roseiflexaceae bacterium]
STAAPTAVAVADLPEVIEAEQLLAIENYEAAISRLTRVYTNYRDDPQAALRLAAAYLRWGEATLARSQGNPALVSTALDRFSSGLAVAPIGEVFDTLQHQVELATAYVAAATILDEIAFTPEAERVPEVIAGQLSTAETELAAVAAAAPAYPGLATLKARALFYHAELWIRQANNSELSEAERLEHLATAAGQCEQASLLDPQLEQLAACLDAIAAGQRAIAASRTPTPQPAQAGRLAVQRLNQDEDPTCIAMQITGIRAEGWSFTLDGTNLVGRFDGAGNARLCGLTARQEGNMRVRTANGRTVSGGILPARGGDIFRGQWLSQ